MNKILQEDFDLAPCMVAGYESFMNGLLNIVHSGPICESVGEQIKSYVLDFVQSHPLDSFDRFSDETYTRNYIGRGYGIRLGGYRDVVEERKPYGHSCSSSICWLHVC